MIAELGKSKVILKALWFNDQERQFNEKMVDAQILNASQEFLPIELRSLGLIENCLK